MAQLIVRKLEPEVVAKLKERAGKNGRSAEEEHRIILRESLLGAGDAGGGHPSFEAYLLAMPEGGTERDFARVEGTIRDADLEN